MADDRPHRSEQPVAADLDPLLRSLLVCPICKGDLIDVEDGLRCDADAVVFPIVDGVPWMLPERARPA